MPPKTRPVHPPVARANAPIDCMSPLWTIALVAYVRGAVAALTGVQPSGVVCSDDGLWTVVVDGHQLTCYAGSDDDAFRFTDVTGAATLRRMGEHLRHDAITFPAPETL